MTLHSAETAEGRQFHRAICETPHDDTPRLVFADWLEEHGYADQAEFIRAQMKVRCVRKDWLVEHGLEALHHREMALFHVHKPSWSWPIRDLCGDNAAGCTFARGFVWQLEVANGRLFVPNARAIFTLHPITKVDFPIVGRWRTSHSPLLRGAIEGNEQIVDFFNGDLTRRGEAATRLPGPIWEFLDRIGLPCTKHGVRAEFRFPVEPALERHIYHIVDEHELVSRAAVAFGRHQAGLPPLVWPPLRYKWTDPNTPTPEE
jgi:uncharacterized protein (TIGR02996 family)